MYLSFEVSDKWEDAYNVDNNLYRLPVCHTLSNLKNLDVPFLLRKIRDDRRAAIKLKDRLELD